MTLHGIEAFGGALGVMMKTNLEARGPDVNGRRSGGAGGRRLHDEKLLSVASNGKARDCFIPGDVLEAVVA